MSNYLRYVGISTILLVIACRPGLLPWQIKVTDQPQQTTACQDNSACPAGFVCREGVCNSIDRGGEQLNPLPPDNEDEPRDTNCLTPNACGNCLPAPYCQADMFEQGKQPFNQPQPNDGVVIDPNGSIQLGTTTANYAEFAWVANSTEGTISRLDTKSNTEIGRYATVKRTGSVEQVAAWNSGCNAPSRTAVDGDGSAYVSNRNLENEACLANSPRMGSVSKIAFYDKFICDTRTNPTLAGCLCKDSNQDGALQTSTDVDGDGAIWLGECAGACTTSCAQDIDCQGSGLAQYCNNNKCSTKPKEFFAEQDECIIWTTSFFNAQASKTNNDIALMRGLAIDKLGRIWAGDHENKRMYVLDANNGAFLDIDGRGPIVAQDGIAVDAKAYGAVADGNNGIWINNLDGTLQYISTADGSIGQLLRVPNESNYAITIDANGWIWTPGRGTQPKMLRYKPLDRNRGVWEIAPSTIPDTFFYGTLPPSAIWIGRGVTTAGNGIIWAVFHEYNPIGGKVWLIGYDQQTGNVVRRQRMDEGRYAQLCRLTIGIGVGYGGVLYMVSQQDNMVCTFDPLTGARDAIPVGRGPYTYSDFTGNIYRNFVRRQGTYTMLAQGCGSNTDYSVSAWHPLLVSSTIPNGAKLQLRYRSSNNMDMLTTLPWSAPITINSGQSIPVAFPNRPRGSLLQLQWTLEASTQGASPLLQGLSINKSCAFSGGG